MFAIVLTGAGETVWKDCMHSFHSISFNIRGNNSKTVIRTELVSSQVFVIWIRCSGTEVKSFQEVAAHSCVSSVREM